MYLNGRLDAAVESDVVGYTTTTITGKGEGVADWYQIAIQFKGLGESEDQIKLGEAINTVGLTPTTWRYRDDAPCIQVYNGSTYDLFYYIKNAYIDPTKTDKTTTEGWANELQVLANDTYLNVGDAFWFRVKNLEKGKTATLTVAGTVSIAQASKTISIGDNEWTLAANPYPTAIAIKDIECSLTPTTWRYRDDAPCIQVYNGSTYDLFYYIKNAYIDPTKTDKTTTEGWANELQVLATEEIPAGVGFWIKTTGTETGTLTFTL